MPEVQQHLTEEKVRKVADLVLKDVPQHQIAKIMNLSPQRVNEIVHSEACATAAQILAAEKSERDDLIAEGWDRVEEIALSRVVDNLTVSSDPDFALRAAAMANRALRKNNLHNRPLQVDGGRHVTLTLNLGYVNQIQTAPAEAKSYEVVQGQANGNGSSDNDRKMVDYLEPKKVERVLGVQTSVNQNSSGEAFEDAFDNFTLEF